MSDPGESEKRVSEVSTPKRGRTAVFAVLLAIQSVAAVFFVGDAVADLTVEDEVEPYIFFEALIAIALVVGVVLGTIEMRRLIERNRRAETALAAASGALADVIDGYFADLKLTPAEAEVAMLALKGFDVAEIAELRGAAAGTVRAQLTRIYSKAGVSNRTQLVSLLVEDLLA